MTVRAENLKAKLGELPASERAALAHFLILSLDEASDADADAAWDEELERRAAEIRSGQAGGESAEKVFSELRGKHA